MEEHLKESGIPEDIIVKLKENDIDLEILSTMTEADLREVGVTSFGIRRKIVLLMRKATKAPPDGNMNVISEAGSAIPPEPTKEAKHESVAAAGSSSSPKSSMKKSSLASYLSQTPQGLALVKHLNAGGILSIPQRQLLVRLSVSHLTEKCGDLYPGTGEKTALAKEIVQTWPATKDATPGLQGHEHFYSEGNGSSFIQSRLKNIRTSQKVRKRGHDGSKRPSLPGDHEEHLQDGEEDEPELDVVVNQQTLEKVEWMKYTVPRQQTKAQLTEVFMDTHKYRQALITQQEMTITDIVNQFPRYRDMPQLIGIEFSLLYGDGCDNFVKKWGTFYRPRIIALAKRDFPTIKQVIADFEESNGDMDVCGLTALLFMLHRPTTRRKGKEVACSRPGALMYLIQNLPVGTDVEAAVQGKESIYRQPFLLSLGEEMKPSQYILVVDKIPLPAATTTVESFDMVFKSHFAFKVEYATPLMPFYTFMAAFVYEVLPPSQVVASVRSLAANIRNMEEI